MNISDTRYLTRELIGILEGRKSYVSPADRPNAETKKGERVIGIINDPISRSLYSFARRITKTISDKTSAKILQELLSGIDESREARELYVVLQNAGQISNVAMRLFWVRVSEEFHDYSDDMRKFGVRTGWKVVLIRNDRLSKISSAIMRFGEQTAFDSGNN